MQFQTEKLQPSFDGTTRPIDPSMGGTFWGFPANSETKALVSGFTHGSSGSTNPVLRMVADLFQPIQGCMRNIVGMRVTEPLHQTFVVIR